jgi:putative ABC transport system permease protein
MQMSRQAVTGIYFLTALVGSIALMNTMIMSVFERTREIGVLRAVGWGRRLVLRQVMTESLLLTIISGVVGTGVTLGIARLFTEFATGAFANALHVTPALIGQALGICVVLGVVGGLYPAWRATRFSPVEALRYE